MKKIAKYVMMAIVGMGLAAQFIRPDCTNPATDPGLSIRSNRNVPPGVLATLERSCFDCHSNETRWPWYSSLTPLNFMVVRDVRNGRQRLNFSEWGKLKPMKQASLLEEVYDQVHNKEMPLKKYLIMHPDALLSDADIKALCDWTEQEQERINAAQE